MGACDGDDPYATPSDRRSTGVKAGGGGTRGRRVVSVSAPARRTHGLDGRATSPPPPLHQLRDPFLPRWEPIAFVTCQIREGGPSTFVSLPFPATDDLPFILVGSVGCDPVPHQRPSFPTRPTPSHPPTPGMDRKDRGPRTVFLRSKRKGGLLPCGEGRASLGPGPDPSHPLPFEPSQWRVQAPPIDRKTPPVSPALLPGFQHPAPCPSRTVAAAPWIPPRGMFERGSFVGGGIHGRGVCRRLHMVMDVSTKRHTSDAMDGRLERMEGSERCVGTGRRQARQKEWGRKDGRTDGKETDEPTTEPWNGNDDETTVQTNRA